MPDSFDPSLNFLYRRHLHLDALFRPKSVALIGATEQEGSVGRTVMHNLLKGGFSGDIFPVNLKRKTVCGIPCFPSVSAIGKPVDLAVIVTPASVVPNIIGECAAANIPAAVIISAGFKEMGEPGIALEREILARKGKMRIIGPNCLGIMMPHVNLNATFAASMAHPGSMAFISQSGALCTAVLDWSLAARVGFSAFVSIGSMVDVDFADLIDYFGHDPHTSSILIYMENLGNARAFLSAAREIALTKPIILIKAGRSEESALAATSHTGALAGSDEAFGAALERVGVLRVDTIADLFGMAESLAKQPRPKGPRLCIITNAGGPGVIATDALIAEGGSLAKLTPQTFAALNSFLPAQWSRNNPVDILGDASPEIYAKTVETIAADPNCDALLVILTPQDMTDPVKTAELLTKVHLPQPIFTSWMGAQSVVKGREILQSASIPTFEYPDQACKTFGLMWAYSRQLQELYETPALPAELFDPSICLVRNQVANSLFSRALEEGRTLLDEVESKQLLAAYHIPTTPMEVAHSPQGAAELAAKMGFPVVLKIYSRTITHKSDIGGVQLNLINEEAVEAAYKTIQAAVKPQDFLGVTVQPMVRLQGTELILGSKTDPELGPLLLFGSGGRLVEVYQDTAVAIPPLTTPLAHQLMEKTKVYKALLGTRGSPPVDLPALENLLVRFSLLLLEQPLISECDINPLLASEKELIALDARIVLHAPGTFPPPPAIRPYPTQYVESWQLKDGSSALIRPIRPEDEPLVRRFHQDLSNETIRQRYLKAIHYEERVAHERLLRICFNDYDREIALVVEKKGELLAIARLTKLVSPGEATFALIVKDKWQNQGIGAKLMKNLLHIARTEQIRRITAYMLEENVQMKTLLARLGFQLKKSNQMIVAEWASS